MKREFGRVKFVFKIGCKFLQKYLSLVLQNSFPVIKAQRPTFMQNFIELRLLPSEIGLCPRHTLEGMYTNVCKQWICVWVCGYSRRCGRSDFNEWLILFFEADSWWWIWIRYSFFIYVMYVDEEKKWLCLNTWNTTWTCHCSWYLNP